MIMTNDDKCNIYTKSSYDAVVKTARDVYYTAVKHQLVMLVTPLPKNPSE